MILCSQSLWKRIYIVLSLIIYSLSFIDFITQRQVYEYILRSVGFYDNGNNFRFNLKCQ